MRDAEVTILPTRSLRPDRVLRLLSRAVRVSFRAAPFWSAQYPRAVRRAIRLMGDELFTAGEIRQLGLLDPGLVDADLRRFTSRQAVMVFEKRLNPVSWRTLVEDKGLFYRHCAALGLPVPRLYALLRGNYSGWSFDDPARASREGWMEFLHTSCPPEFIIKPALGAYGCDVRLMTRAGEATFIEAPGKPIAADTLLDRLCAEAGDGGWVIQERIRNHPLLAELCGSAHLQCLRLLTLLDGSRGCQVLHGHHKIIVGENVVDNFHFGDTGNLTARVDLANGTLGAALNRAAHGVGYTPVEDHPLTGKRIRGVPLPFWKEACALACEAAHQFSPLRFVGWDIALTASRPVLIEANWNCDPTNPHRNMDRIRKAMTDSITGGR